MISIIIPAYNAGSTLERTLRSIANQTIKDFEAIIIDDGSIDSTSSIAKTFSKYDSRFIYYYQKNSGVAIARNKGIELSNGEYISFLDADDYFEKDCLEKMYKKIIKCQCDICYCGYNIVKNNLKKIKISRFKSNNILIDFILGRTSIHTNCWLIKKDVLNKHNIIFTPGVSWGEDFEFFCGLLANVDNICYVAEHLSNYIIYHDKNQLSSFSLDKINKDYESIMRIVNNPLINKNKAIEKALLDYRLQALIIYRLISALKKENDLKEIKMYYEKYRNYIKKFTFNNGLRSVKLNLNKVKLIKNIRTVSFQISQ